ncbi:MAG TPA: glycosyltransferase [Terriglobales bacterium]
MISFHFLRTALIIAAWLMAFDWIRRSIPALSGMAAMPDVTVVDESTSPALPEGEEPHLSVIVPARNEQDTIIATLESLLQSKGIRLQIIAIDDRSSDATGERMESVAVSVATGPYTIEVIRNRELPSGWLGKPHALALGVERAKAPWILFTDADVEFAPDALAPALRMAMREMADHFVLVPTLTHRGALVAAVQAAVQALATASARGWKIADPRAKDFFGVGAFNLVRSDVLRSFGGIDRLRMEVIEDVSIGWLVKHELRGRSMMVLGPGLVKIEWIKGMFGIVRLLEKNAFAGLRYSVGMALLICFGLALQGFVPLLALGAGPWGIAASLAFHCGVGLGYLANRKLNAVSPWFALLYTPCAAILCWAFFRSTVLVLWRGGVAWRGTLYPLADLRKNMIPWKLRP